MYLFICISEETKMYNSRNNYISFSNAPIIAVACLSFILKLWRMNGQYEEKEERNLELRVVSICIY